MAQLFFEIMKYLSYSYILKLTNLPNKQLKTALQFILGGIMMMFFAVGCSDSSSKKETNTDSVVVSDSLKVDTIKMDTANTKPIVNPPDEPAK